MFDDFNTAQWLWCFYNDLEDRTQIFEHDRDMVEYQASFVEPEAVRKIREAREEAVRVPDKEFVAGIEQMFGRGINLPSQPQKGTVSEVMDVKKAEQVADEYKKFKEEQASRPRSLESSFWVNFDLE